MAIAADHAVAQNDASPATQPARVDAKAIDLRDVGTPVRPSVDAVPIADVPYNRQADWAFWQEPQTLERTLDYFNARYGLTAEQRATLAERLGPWVAKRNAYLESTAEQRQAIAERTRELREAAKARREVDRDEWAALQEQSRALQKNEPASRLRLERMARHVVDSKQEAAYRQRLRDSVGKPSARRTVQQQRVKPTEESTERPAPAARRRVALGEEVESVTLDAPRSPTTRPAVQTTAEEIANYADWFIDSNELEGPQKAAAEQLRRTALDKLERWQRANAFDYERLESSGVSANDKQIIRRRLLGEEQTLLRNLKRDLNAMATPAPADEAAKPTDDASE